MRLFYVDGRPYELPYIEFGPGEVTDLGVVQEGDLVRVWGNPMRLPAHLCRAAVGMWLCPLHAPDSLHAFEATSSCV